MNRRLLLRAPQAPGPSTVFAPTHEAFQAVPATTLEELASDPAGLKDLVSHHVLAAKLTAAQVQSGNAKTR